MDPATAAFIASCKEKEGATKKLPTIFKFNGNAKDVYVCGKKISILSYLLRPMILLAVTIGSFHSFC